MTPMTPDDLAAMFDLPPLPAAATPAAEAEDALEAAEAALAAEMASTIDSEGVAGDAPDSRAGSRVKVAWAARLWLPGGRLLELEVRDISEGGVGLSSAEPIPADTVVDFEMSVPPLHGVGEVARLTGAIRTTCAVAHGPAMRCGGVWLTPPSRLELVIAWIEASRR